MIFNIIKTFGTPIEFIHKNGQTSGCCWYLSWHSVSMKVLTNETIGLHGSYRREQNRLVLSDQAMFRSHMISSTPASNTGSLYMYKNQWEWCGCVDQFVIVVNPLYWKDNQACQGDNPDATSCKLTHETAIPIQGSNLYDTALCSHHDIV